MNTFTIVHTFIHETFLNTTKSKYCIIPNKSKEKRIQKPLKWKEGKSKGIKKMILTAKSAIDCLSKAQVLLEWKQKKAA